MRKTILLFAATAFLATGSAYSSTGVPEEGTMKVQGNCSMCKKNIEGAAKSVKGVESASWNKETKELQFQYNEEQASPEAVSKAIAKVGYDTEKDKAKDKVYDALPGCCKYRK
jgi:Cu(I)/Ag(I) efflux system membrane fusion protein